MQRLTRRQAALLQHIAASDYPVTGKSLAISLDCSVRTVQSEVARININEKVIQSTNRGYIAPSRDAVSKLLDAPNEEGASTEWLILKLISKNDGALGVDDIAEKLYMSSSSVEREIKNVRRIVEAHSLKLVRKQGSLSIEGNEHDKRSLIGSLVSQEAVNSMSRYGGLSEYFDDMDISRVRTCTLSVIENQGHQIKQGYAQNLITSIAVALYRMRHGLHVPDPACELSDRDAERSIASELCSMYARHHDVAPTQGDIDYLATLLIGQVESRKPHDDAPSQEKSLQVLEGVRSIVEDVFGSYQLEIDSEQALRNFSVHVQALIERREEAQIKDTDALENIKLNCPFIYELSVLIAWRISEMFGVIVSDGEVGFICIHVGMLLLSTLENDKVRILLACDHYQGISQRIREALDRRYQDVALLAEIDIEGLRSIDSEADVIITTRKSLCKSSGSVLISPFFTADDQVRVERIIDTAVQNRKNSRQRALLEPFFTDGLFLSTDEPMERDDLIRKMGTLLQQEGVVDDEFIDLVLKREELSSTCMFDLFAIPHSVEMNAKRTMVCVALCHKGVAWNGPTIKLALMIAVCHDDRRRFLEVFDIIVKACSDRERSDRLSKSTSLQEFLDILVNGSTSVE